MIEKQNSLATDEVQFSSLQLQNLRFTQSYNKKL